MGEQKLAANDTHVPSTLTGHVGVRENFSKIDNLTRHFMQEIDTNMPVNVAQQIATILVDKVQKYRNKRQAILYTEQEVLRKTGVRLTPEQWFSALKVADR